MEGGIEGLEGRVSGVVGTCLVVAMVEPPINVISSLEAWKTRGVEG